MYVHPAVSLSKFTDTPEDLIAQLGENEDTQWFSRMTYFSMLQTPETRLIQYDCGKLQVLAKLLQDLKAGDKLCFAKWGKLSTRSVSKLDKISWLPHQI